MVGARQLHDRLPTLLGADVRVVPVDLGLGELEFVGQCGQMLG